MVTTYLGLDWTPVAISSLCPLDWSTTTWEWQPEKSVIHSGSKYILCYDFYWANLFSFDHWCIDDSVGWELKIYATRSTIESTFIIFNYMYLKCHVFFKKKLLVATSLCRHYRHSKWHSWFPYQPTLSISTVLRASTYGSVRYRHIP